MEDHGPPWAAQADLFAFTPVPTANDVSTKRSKKGTLIFFAIFLAYFLYTFYNFISVNTPRINQFENPLDDAIEYDAPEMAFAFVRGDNLNESFYNTSYFFFKFEHVIIPQDLNLPRQYIEIPLVTCRPKWLQPTFDLLCPTKPTTIQGLLYGSPVHKYPRMKVSLCKNSTSGSFCETEDNINWVLMTGRLFVFLKQYARYNYANGSEIPDSTPYLSYYYFLIMDMYNRAEVKVQAENITILPDLFTSFSDQYIETLKISGQNFYVSKVPTTVTHSLFVWWCSMAENTILTTVAFATLLDVLSDVGAIWGLLFAIFTLYFWEYNRRYYYEKKPEMTNFDEKITPFVAATENIQIAASKTKAEETQVKSRVITDFLQKMVFDKEIELNRVRSNRPEEEAKTNNELQEPLLSIEEFTSDRIRERDRKKKMKTAIYDYNAVFKDVTSPAKKDQTNEP